MKAFFGVIGALVAAALLVFALTGVGWFNYDFWGVKFVNSEHRIFENSQPFIDGQIRELTRLQLQYEQADEGHRAALRSMILTEAATISDDQLPSNLRAFLSRVRGGVS